MGDPLKIWTVITEYEDFSSCSLHRTREGAVQAILDDIARLGDDEDTIALTQSNVRRAAGLTEAFEVTVDEVLYELSLCEVLT